MKKVVLYLLVSTVIMQPTRAADAPEIEEKNPKKDFVEKVITTNKKHKLLYGTLIAFTGINLLMYTYNKGIFFYIKNFLKQNFSSKIQNQDRIQPQDKEAIEYTQDKEAIEHIIKKTDRYTLYWVRKILLYLVNIKQYTKNETEWNEYITLISKELDDRPLFFDWINKNYPYILPDFLKPDDIHANLPYNFLTHSEQRNIHKALDVFFQTCYENKKIPKSLYPLVKYDITLQDYLRQNYYSTKLKSYSKKIANEYNIYDYKK